MITSAQKAHLKDILGYDPSHIRTLTPLQASIIVENDLPPGNGELVERLLQEHEALRRMELEKQSLELQRKLDSNAISRSRQEYCTTDSPNRWFSVIEVVTHRNDDRNVKTHESTVALYRKEEEARLCVDLKTDFARRAGQSHVTYRVTDGQSS